MTAVTPFPEPTTDSPEQDYKRLFGALVRLETVLREISRVEHDVYESVPMNDGRANLNGAGLALLHAEVIPAAEALVTLTGEMGDRSRPTKETPVAARGFVEARQAWKAALTVLAAAHAVTNSEGPFQTEDGHHPMPTEIGVMTVAHGYVRDRLGGVREWGQHLGMEEEGAPA